MMDPLWLILIIPAVAAASAAFVLWWVAYQTFKNW